QRPDPVEISRELDQLGGGVNAVTDRELTIYYGKMTPDAALHGLALLSDLIQNSILLDQEIERERGVILEELAAVEDSPPELVAVALDGLLWRNQPHG
ncbi:MAG TPA: insulinase family protein, partial [Dehalococcoidia bacterium]|nr:insulinase family protein [Dehalococcoidia bacterium]